jgi:beta-galactosidase
MRELGLAVIRMAEFAWSILEPTEGTFDFELFDWAIDLAHSHGQRRHYNYNAPIYRELSARIVRAVAERYASTRRWSAGRSTTS